jgi:hypothetical protein
MRYPNGNPTPQLAAPKDYQFGDLQTFGQTGPRAKQVGAF